jgi:hypothetical protein
MANYKFVINTITKRLLQQLLTWDDANDKRRCKTSQTTVFRQLSNSPWTGLGGWLLGHRSIWIPPAKAPVQKDGPREMRIKAYRSI